MLSCCIYGGDVSTSTGSRTEHPTWLIVEDDQVDRQMLDRAVHRSGIDVVLAVVEDGRSSLRYLDDAEVMPALIMLDLNLPDIPGTDVLAEIRENSRTVSIPVLVLSGNTDQKLIDQAYRNGANAYFAKPDTPDELVTLVAQIHQHWHRVALLPR